MASNADSGIQSSVDSVAQNKAQTNPASGDSSPAVTSTPHTSPASNTPDYRADARFRKKRAEVATAISKADTFDDLLFARWETRQECAKIGIHRSTEAGICGTAERGADSIVLSGVYEDDEDQGDVIIYTGAGGREKQTRDRLRPGPQTEDRSWDHNHNKALLASVRTKKPIRVIRSSKSASKYAPLSGYRYDGLYKATECWTGKGKSGWDICRCRLERQPGQAPIPLRPDDV